MSTRDPTTTAPSVVDDILASVPDADGVTRKDMIQALGEITPATDLSGTPPTVVVTFSDPNWKIFRSGICDLDADGQLPLVDINYPPGTSVWWRLAMVDISNDLTQQNLTLTFQSRAASYMQNCFGAFKAAQGTATRAQFVKSLVDRVPTELPKDLLGRGETKLRFICPDIGVTQPVMLTSDQSVVTPETAAAQDSALNKKGAAGAGAKLTVKGQPISTTQLAVANIGVSVGQALKAPVEAIIACIYAGMGESSLGDDSDTYSKTAVSVGPWQGPPHIWLDASQPLGVDVRAQCTAFYDGVKGFRAGGAISRAVAGDPAWKIANEVEANAVWNSSHSDSYAHDFPGGQSDGIAEATAIVNAGGGLATTKISSPATVSLSGYVNPLSKIGNLIPERVDMGVDYAGAGPLLALGDGTIGSILNFGWPGGAFIELKLANGPYAGKFVYYAENIVPLVVPGQKVNAGDVLGTLINASPHLEIGWGAGTGGQSLAAKYSQQFTDGDPGDWSSAAGCSFNTLLIALGAKSGIVQPGGPHGNMPPGYPSTSGHIGALATIGTAAVPGAASTAPLAPVSDISQLQRGGTSNPDENTWSCVQRLATEVNWDFFIDPQPIPGHWGDYVYFISQTSLAGHRPAAYLELDVKGVDWTVTTDDGKHKKASTGVILDFNATIDNTAFGVQQDQGLSTTAATSPTHRPKIVRSRTPQTPTQIQLSMTDAPFEFNSGLVFVLHSAGALNGRWILESTSRNTFADAFTQYTLQTPTAAYPEPQATSTSPVSVTAPTALPAGESTTLAGAVTAARSGLKNKARLRYQKIRPIQYKFLSPPYPVFIDCSGFVIACYKYAGLDDPSGNAYNGQGDTGDMITNCTRITQGDAVPGDMCFFGPSESNTVHVNIYVGNGQSISMGMPGDPEIGPAAQMGPGGFLGYYRAKSETLKQIGDVTRREPNFDPVIR